MDALNNPVVKIVIGALFAANATALIVYASNPNVVRICTILSAVLAALGGGSVKAANNELRGARAELKAVQGGKP